MKTIAVLACSLLLGTSVRAGPPSTGPHPIYQKSPNSWLESFENPFSGWKDRWLYKHTNARGYNINPSGDQQALWIGARGSKVTAPSFTLEIKPSLGLETTYFSLGVNNHLNKLSIRFIDKKGKTIAISCVPRRGYRQFVTVAVKIKNGLSAIHFDGHGTQVSGNVMIDNVEAIFGPVPENKKDQIHEMQNGECKVIQPKPNKR